MAPRTSLPEGVHRVRAKLADGKTRFYFSLRGVPKSRFFIDEMAYPRTADFHAAYAAAQLEHSPRACGTLTSSVVDEFLGSPQFTKLKDRTQADYRLWIDRFTKEFGADAIQMFAEWDSLAEVEEWRDRWKHSPKQYDYAGTVVTRFLNWAVKRGKLKRHHCSFEKVYKPDRAHITWRPEYVEKFLEVAPESICRVLVAAVETGLRPADLVNLRRFNVETLASGNRRLRIPTEKRGEFAHIPVTAAMAKIIDSAPEGQEYILTNPSGKPWTARYASQRISHWKNQAGLTKEALGYSLHMHDCRGTATTKLLEAGADAIQLATVFGWNLRYATQMVEVYAVVGGDKTDRILALVEKAEKNAK